VEVRLRVGVAELEKEALAPAVALSREDAEDERDEVPLPLGVPVGEAPLDREDVADIVPLTVPLRLTVPLGVELLVLVCDGIAETVAV
jgi:hypothetical protein